METAGYVTSGAVTGIAVVSAVASWTVAPAALLGRRRAPSPAGEHETGPARALTHPGLWFLIVTGLIYLNQVLFTVYVIRVHGGDPSFVARFLPAGWFDLADGNPVIRTVARLFPAPALLAPTVLRVQAFLELPFVVFAYLTVCRWLDPALYLRVIRSPLVWLASVSYTLTFCAIEWALRNPYTASDLVLRLVAALVVPVWVGVVAGRTPGQEGPGYSRPKQAPGSPPALLAFAVSVWAMGYLVLAVYDTALLYNLGHLGARLPGIGLAVAVLATARWGARLAGTHGSAPPRAPLGTDTLVSSLRWFVALFLVMALAVRYAAAEPAVQVIGAATVVAAAACGGTGALRRARRSEQVPRSPTGTVVRWVLQLAVALLAGLAAAYAALSWVQGRYPEAALLHAGAALVVTVIVCCGAIDWAVARRTSAPRGH